jgi:hypothetical protein
MCIALLVSNFEDHFCQIFLLHEGAGHETTAYQRYSYTRCHYNNRDLQVLFMRNMWVNSWWLPCIVHAGVISNNIDALASFNAKLLVQVPWISYIHVQTSSIPCAHIAQSRDGNTAILETFVYMLVNLRKIVELLHVRHNYCRGPSQKTWPPILSVPQT